MNKTLRKAVIAGNWKMNKTPAEAKVLIDEIAPLVKDADCSVITCVPYVDLCTALEATKGTNIEVGAENCHWEKSGAYTGEISAEMLASIDEIDGGLIALTRFSGEIGWYHDEYLEIIRTYLGK